ncbi:MAG: hypothetical protein ABJ215_17185 [Alphaproteobacteria bacterium]
MNSIFHRETSVGRTYPVGKPVSKLRNAAALSAALAFSVAGPAQAQSERFPAGPANMFKPGAVFLYYDGTTDPARIEGLNAALNTMTAQSAETARTMQTVRAGIENGVADSSRDELAHTVATSIEGTFSIVVQAGFMQALARTSPNFGQMFQNARTNMQLPNGEAIELPVLLAAAVHSLSVVGAGERMRDESTARALAGDYDLATTGTCAVPEGNVALAQKDFILEGVIDDRLAVFGTLGDMRIYMVSNEQRFAQVTENAGAAPTIDVPDQASDLFEAVLPAPGAPIEFRSIARGTCRFTLTPASP